MYENLCKPLNVDKNIRLYSGTGNPKLAQRIADILHLELSGLKLEKFSNGETYARFEETVGYDTVIESGATVGPRAYLRPGTHLLAGAHVGTHVEIKNSTIGEGSKVPHLSYIGDTTMGSGVNIGAGSITCNYDGKHKSPTVIGNDVFIGSDTMMVAPVTIGDGALVGASSCITEDVPADALALERSRQMTVEGWAAARRKRMQEEA
jgi:bifunctional UDP-N-acetylglucosamine pyrophosphorylase/glucosamine-1-phosphate N-acetyltransferase